VQAALDRGLADGLEQERRPVPDGPQTDALLSAALKSTRRLPERASPISRSRLSSSCCRRHMCSAEGQNGWTGRGAARDRRVSAPGSLQRIVPLRYQSSYLLYGLPQGQLVGTWLFRR
jgi:hypothetical protein